MESKPFMQDKCEDDMHSLAEDMVYNKLEHECNKCWNRRTVCTAGMLLAF